MDLPKFLIADSSALEDVIFIVHTEYPRFLNVATDEIYWMEEFQESREELESQTALLVERALEFYDKEMESLD